MLERFSVPFGRIPESGFALEVRTGIYWIRMPLSYVLNHINLWVIDDRENWTVVDTGTSTEESKNVWHQIFANFIDMRSISRVFVTHMHPDHVGMAGWLTRKFSASLWMTRLEYLSCRVMVSDMEKEAPPEGTEFYRLAGWPESVIEIYKLQFDNFGKYISKLPGNYRRIIDGEKLTIGSQQWLVITAGGHSPEHACFYCPELKVLISGDLVLPRISSNVSVFATEPEANPMKDWLASLDRLEREIPDDVLVLPSHNEPFIGLHNRLKELRWEQIKKFQCLINTLSEPKRAIDVFDILFSRKINQEDISLFSLATGEAIACLNYLMYEGRVKRSLGVDQVFWYEKI